MKIAILLTVSLIAVIGAGITNATGVRQDDTGARHGVYTGTGSNVFAPAPGSYYTQPTTNNFLQKLFRILIQVELFKLILPTTTTATATTTVTTTVAAATTTSSYVDWVSATGVNCVYSLYRTSANGNSASAACGALGARLATTGIQTVANRLAVLTAAGALSTTIYVGFRDTDGSDAEGNTDALWDVTNTAVGTAADGFANPINGGTAGSECGRITATNPDDGDIIDCSTTTTTDFSYYLCEYCG